MNSSRWFELTGGRWALLEGGSTPEVIPGKIASVKIEADRLYVFVDDEPRRITVRATALDGAGVPIPGLSVYKTTIKNSGLLRQTRVDTVTGADGVAEVEFQGVAPGSTAISVTLSDVDSPLIAIRVDKSNRYGTGPGDELFPRIPTWKKGKL